MKTRFILFRRNGVFYTEDTASGKQTSLRTKDETEAKSLLILIRFQDETNSGSVLAWQDHVRLIHSS